MILGKRRPVRVGLSARIYHPQQGASGIFAKTLQVLERSIAEWVMARGVLVLMVPSVLQDSPAIRSHIRLRDYAEYLDCLILQGGADVSPLAYGEEPLRPEWSGDAVRDAYELELLQEFMEAGKPVLGICRGMQLINVAMGGALYQDLPTQCPGSIVHEAGAFDRNIHDISFVADSQLARWFDGTASGGVVSIHHQGIKRLGRDLVVEATSEDEVIEAIRWKGRSFVFGVQWHPEFHNQPGANLIDCKPLLEAFLAAAG